MKLRVVNYYTTDEDGEKVYIGHAIQTQEVGGDWCDIPVTEEYVSERLVIVKPDGG